MYQLQTLSVSCEFPVTFLPGTFFYIYLNGSAGTQPSPPSVLEFYAVLAAASYCPDIRNRNSAQSQPGCRCPGGEGALPLSRTLSFSALRGLLSPSWVVRFMKKLPVSRVVCHQPFHCLLLWLCALLSVRVKPAPINTTVLTYVKRLEEHLTHMKSYYC